MEALLLPRASSRTRPTPCRDRALSAALDWQMWFAAMGTPEEYPWTIHLVWKLLHNDPGRALAVRGESVPRPAAALCARGAVPLCVRAAGRSRATLVDARGAGALAAAALRRQRAPARGAAQHGWLDKDEPVDKY
jgi:hypothetical protein